MLTRSRRAGMTALAVASAVALLAAGGIVAANAATGGGSGAAKVMANASAAAAGAGQGNGAVHDSGAGSGDTDDSGQPQPTEFTTQDGSATITLPADWSVVDVSGESDWHGTSVWHNDVELWDPEGVHRMHFTQTVPDLDAWVEVEDVVILDERPVAEGLSAVSWYGTHPHGIVGYIGLADMRGEVPGHYPFTSADRITMFSTNLHELPGCDVTFDDRGATFASAAEAESCLTSERAEESLAVVASLQLHEEIPPYEPEPGPAPEPAPEPSPGAPVDAFTTANGTASFDFEGDWSVVDSSGSYYGNDGELVWINTVEFERAGGGTISYSDNMTWGDSGPGVEDAIVTDRIELANGYDVVSLLSTDEYGVYPGIYVLERGASEPSYQVPSPVAGRDFYAIGGLWGLDGCTDLTTVEEGEACLASAAADDLRAALATMQQHDVPVDAEP